MKSILLILLAITFTTLHLKTEPLQGQAKLDSLLSELPKAKGDTNEVKLLSAISYYFKYSNPDKGIEYGQKGVKLAKKINWRVGEVDCYNSLGVNFRNQSNYPKALEYYFKALKINEVLGNKRNIASNLGNIGLVYSIQSNYPKALEYFLKALKINEVLGNKEGISRNLGNIGIVYYYQSNYSKALEYFFKSLKINEEFEDKSGIALNLGNIGNIYSNQSYYSKAKEYFFKALKINEVLEDKSGIALNLGNIGVLYLTLSRDSVIKNIDNKTELLLNRETNLNKAIKYTNQAITLYKEIGELDYQSQLFSSLSEAYKLKGDYKNAYESYKEFKQLQDSVFSQKNADKIAALEKSREEDLKQKEIEKQKIRIAEQEKREQLILYFSIGFFIVMSIVMFVIYRLLKRSDKLLYNVLPVSIAKRLKKKEHPISDNFTQASIIFIDIVNFTVLSRDADPQRIVLELNKIFTHFDTIADKYGLEKIKTIGDSYMAAAGIPEVQKDNTHRAAQMALEVKELMVDYHTADGTKIEVRIGLDCGPVVAGVIGEKKFIYDMWSDAVNTASRMESSSVAGEIQVSERFKEAVSKYQDFAYTERGEIEIKGKGKMKTYFMGSVKIEA